MKMKLYEFGPTRSIRVRWTLQELGVDFEPIRVNLVSGEHQRHCGLPSTIRRSWRARPALPSRFSAGRLAGETGKMALQAPRRLRNP